MVPSPIVGIRVVVATGLFNPYTVVGDIFVNGILASSHSSWFLEDTGMSDSSIVALYNIVLKPLSLLYYLKPSAFQCFQEEHGEKDSLSEMATSKLVSCAVKCLMSTSQQDVSGPNPGLLSEHNGLEDQQNQSEPLAPAISATK